MELKDRIVERLPKRKLIRYDLLPVITDRDLSKDIVNTLAEPYRGKIDMVVAPEAIGWILGDKVADHLGVDFLPLRRGNKLPYEEDDLYRVLHGLSAQKKIPGDNQGCRSYRQKDTHL